MVSYEELEKIDNPSYESLQSIWNSWSQYPIKATILQTVFTHLAYDYFWGSALCQKGVCSSSPTNGEEKLLLKCCQDMGGFNDALLYQMPSLNILYQLYQRREIWSSRISDIQEEGINSSSYAPAPEGHATVGPGGV